jgi:hypothetical protein
LSELMARLAAITFLLLSVLASTAHASLRTTTFVLERTSAAPVHLQLMVWAGPGWSAGEERHRFFIGMIAERPGRHDAISLGQWAAGDDDLLPSATVAGNRFGCPTFGCGQFVAAGILGAAADFSDAGASDPDRLGDIYVVVQDSAESNPAPEAEFVSGGEAYRIVKRPLTYRFVGTEDAAVSASTGSYLPETAVEVSTGAELPGGANGSVAAAVPPCGGATSHGLWGIGVGETTLSGGTTTPKGSCEPGHGGQMALAAAADGPTTWRLTDDPVSAGETGGQGLRLLVVDRPADGGA